jgi:uncharacterized repeat protein (TIGR01451 family)
VTSEAKGPRRRWQIRAVGVVIGCSVAFGISGSATATESEQVCAASECMDKSATLIVDKVVTGAPADDPTRFNFTLARELEKTPDPKAEVSGPPMEFNLANGESKTITMKDFAGKYRLTETQPVAEGYQFVGVRCKQEDSKKNGADPVTFVYDGASVSFGDVNYGTVIRCTYTNLKLPKLTVTKALTNSSGAGLATAFPFSISGQADFSLAGGQSTGPRILPVGSYTITEGAVPAGFTFTSANCTKPGTVNGQAVTVDLAAGDDVTCTFTNNQTPPPPPVTPEPPPAVVTKVLSPRLTIVKTGPLRARPLQRFNYTIRVRNPGRAVARNVVVTDRLPSGLVYLRTSRRATVKGRVVTVRMGNLRPGQVRTVRITVRAAANVRGRKVNVAVARANNVRPVRDTAPTVFRPLVRRTIPAVTG